MQAHTRVLSTLVFNTGNLGIHVGAKTVGSLALLFLSLATPGRSSVETRLASPTFHAPAAPSNPLTVVSWYGSKFQGRRTANGERFDRLKLTAAHRTLPLGSVVRLTVPATGKSVVVRINDRGPWLKGRDFDLSEQAASVLGIHEQGIAALQATVLSTGPLQR